MFADIKDGQGSRKDIRPVLVLGDGEHDNESTKGQQVGNQAGNKKKLGKLARGPGALQVAAALVQRDAGDAEREDVTLNERSRQKRPWVDDGQLGDEVEVGNDNVRLGGPLAIADGGAEEGLDDEHAEGDARHRREV